MQNWSRPLLSNRNLMQATYVILNSLAATLKKLKGSKINFNNLITIHISRISFHRVTNVRIVNEIFLHVFLPSLKSSILYPAHFSLVAKFSSKIPDL